MNFTRLSIMGLVLALTACAESGTINRAKLQSIYSPQLVHYVARSGSLPVAIHGNPFASAGSEAHARIVEGMDDVPALYGASFSLLTRDQPRPDGRVVLIFNAKGSVRGICQEPAAYTPGASGGTIRIDAAFCIGDRAASSVRGSLPAADTPDDPAFRRGLNRLLAALLPRSYGGGGGSAPGG